MGDFDEREKWVHREIAKKLVEEVIDAAISIIGTNADKIYLILT